MTKFLLSIEIKTKDNITDLTFGDSCDHMRHFIDKMKDLSKIFTVEVKEIAPNINHIDKLKTYRFLKNDGRLLPLKAMTKADLTKLIEEKLIPNLKEDFSNSDLWIWEKFH